jgi:hypothetical protein
MRVCLPGSILTLDSIPLVALNDDDAVPEASRSRRQITKVGVIDFNAFGD